MCIQRLEQRQNEDVNSVVDMDLSVAWFGLGDLDKGFYYMHQCIDKKVGPVSYFLEHPLYERLKDDPRYHDAKRRMGLPESLQKAAT